jgi:proliferating cell nuclear antigen
MFKAKIKAKKIRELIDIAELVSSEMKLKTQKKGFDITIVDPTKIAMVQLHLKDEAFEEYSTDETEFAIELEKLQSILKLASGDTLVEFEYNDKQKEHLTIKIENLRRRMRLNDPFEAADPRIPDLKLPGQVTLSTSELIKGVRAANDISDHLRLTISEKEFELSADGDTDEVSLKLNK